MSFQAKTTAVLNQQLQIQEVMVRAADTNLYVVNAGDVCIIVGEALDSCDSALFHDNSAATLTSVVAVNRIISDSTAFTAGGDRKAVRLDGVAALDANDSVIMRYSVTE